VRAAATPAPTAAAIDNVRAVVSAACDCSGTAAHRKYVKCAKEIIKDAIADGTLQKTCKKPVLRCEARSTCGRAKSKICCVTSPKGKVKALTVRGDKCPRQGKLCDHPMALADACERGRLRPAEGHRSFKSIQRVMQTSRALPTCHSTFQRQGGLRAETEDVSYKSLVDRPAELPEAAGLVRVLAIRPRASSCGSSAGRGLVRTCHRRAATAEPIIQMIED
jgi:hypothetical protein